MRRIFDITWVKEVITDPDRVVVAVSLDTAYLCERNLPSYTSIEHAEALRKVWNDVCLERNKEILNHEITRELAKDIADLFNNQSLRDGFLRV